VYQSNNPIHRISKSVLIKIAVLNLATRFAGRGANNGIGGGTGSHVQISQGNIPSASFGIKTSPAIRSFTGTNINPDNFSANIRVRINASIAIGATCRRTDMTAPP
jgi:hypothetical protein